MLRIFFSLTLALGPVYAQNECTQALAVNTPCSGVLLPPAEAAKAAKCLMVRLPQCEANLDRCTRESAARFERCKKQLSAYAEFTRTLGQHLDKALEIPPTNWWESDSFIYGLGVATGVAVVLGGAWALKKVN